MDVRRYHAISVFLVFFLVFSIGSPLAVANMEVLDDYSGPYVDRIRFEVHYDATFMPAAYALIDGDVDISDFPLAHDPYQELEGKPNIGFTDTGNLGNWWFAINCQRWPLNVSGVRRALLYALDKLDAASFWDPQYSLLDSVLSRQHPMSIEDEMEQHYYDKDIESGAALLDSLGFIDSDDDGWREGPGGVELPDIWVMHGGGGARVAPTISQAFLDLNISSYADFPPAEGPGFLDRIYSGDYFMVPFESYVGDQGIDFDYWANQFLSENIGDMDTYAGWTRWSNATWDALAEVVLHSTDYDEIVEAVKEMQYIMLEDCPRISLFSQLFRTAYRTDTYEGFVEDVLVGASSFWSAMKVHQIGESTGGTLRWAVHNLNLKLDHFGTDYPLNYGRGAPYGNYMSIARFLFDPLARIGPDFEEVLWLAESYSIETAADNPIPGQSPIPEGHTRITVELNPNATWSDDNPLTAADCVYSIQWFNENYGDVSENLADLYACYSPTPNTLVVEFSSESWWHWHSICYIPVLPFHMSSQHDRLSPGGVGVTGEEFEALVVSGPFLPSEYEPGNYCEIVQNPDHWMNPRPYDPIIDTTTTTTTTTTPPPPDLTLAIVAGSIGAALVIVVGVCAMRRE
ncbi:MAG: ABC transporter substrate-binding protein [Candidatus Thorarchaeota archaeon]